MKRQSHTVTKLPNNRASVAASWTTQMREPGHVRITTEKATERTPGLLYEGDEGEVFKTFSGLAEIAWEMGWRPKGLAQVLGMVVAEFKLPKS